jgi:hypothetical protein
VDLLLPLVSKTIIHSLDLNISLQSDSEMMMLIMAMAGGSSNMLLLAQPQQLFRAPSLKELIFPTTFSTLRL